MRNGILVAHRWLGLILGVLVALSGLSGSALIFRPQLEPQVLAPLLRVPVRTQRANWQTIYDNAQRKFPKENIQFIFVAKTADASHEIWMRDGDLLAYADPYSGAILGEREPQRDFWGWLAKLHIDLLNGDRGHIVVGIGGIAMLLLGISGLWLWWPRGTRNGERNWRRAFVPNFRTNWKGRIYEWHRVAGFWAHLALIVTALTGIALVWPNLVTLAAQPFNTPEAKAKTEVVARGDWRSLDELVASAELAFPEGQLRRITFPAKADAPLIIRKKLPEEMHPNGMNNITLDPYSARVLSIKDTRRANWETRLMNLRYPLHIGEWGGWASKVFYALLGFVPLSLFVSGLMMWNVKRRARQKRHVQNRA